MLTPISGVVNFVGSFFHCFTAFGSLPRSAIADTSGAKTQLAGAIAGIIVLFTLYFASAIFYYLPSVVLAAVIIKAVSGLLEKHELILFWRIRAIKDIFMLLFTFVVTIAMGVETGLLLSLSVSVLMVIRHTSLPHISILGKTICLIL